MTTELRKTGIDAVGGMTSGTHFCVFYETKEDLLDTLVSYFKAGLENNEFCLWVISGPLTEEEMKSALRQAVPDLDRYLAERILEIVPHDEWFLKKDGFDLHGTINRLNEKLAQALARGCAGMRVSGSTTSLQNKDLRNFLEFERALEDAVIHQRVIMLCTFPLATSGTVEILYAARTHQTAVSLRNWNWEVVETPERNQSKEEIKALNEKLKQRVIERTRALATANEKLKREIAERMQVEDELRKQKEILQKIFDHIPVMIRFLDADGRVKLVNREWERTLGWNLEEVQERNLEIYAEIYPDPEYRQYVLNFITTSNAEWADFKTRVRDGRVIDTVWANVHLSDGTSIGIGQDITERKRAEEALRESEQRFRATSQQLRALSASLQSAREEERTRIAREIHDEMGSALTSLKWDLEALDKMVADSPNRSQLAALREKIGSMIKLADTTIHAIRRIAAELRPSLLDDLGLVEAIEWQAQQFQARTGIACHCSRPLEDLNLSREQSTAVFRIFQEALTNVLRHAQATRVDITMEEEADEFVLTIRDNGRGIREDEKSGPLSLGMLGMQERAHLVGGRIHITGVDRRGTTVTVRVPLAG